MDMEDPDARPRDAETAAERYWRIRTRLAYARTVIWVLWMLLATGDGPPVDPLA